MRTFLCILIACCCFVQAKAEKYALIIAIGDYPSTTGWGPISSTNDIPLIQEGLEHNAFDAQNIIILRDEEATKKGILAAFATLENKLQPGDMVVIHYSGHGQQIYDDNGDEIDGLDEALIPYDAFAKFMYNYKGESHLRDDELGALLNGLRMKTGPNGQVLVMLDSCHSGTATRGGKARGTKTPLIPEGWVVKADPSAKSAGTDMYEKETKDAKKAPLVMISGASANELNYEYNGYGSLSYAFSKALGSLGTNITYRQLFAKITAVMLQISPRQTPTIEGDIDYYLFKGEYARQQAYYQVASIKNSTMLSVQGGTFQGLYPNATVAVYPAGTINIQAAEKIGSGKVLLSTLNKAVIRMDTVLTTKNAGDLWVFVEQPTYGKMDLNVYLDPADYQTDARNKLNAYLEEHELGTVVNDTLNSDVIVEKSGTQVLLRSTNGKTLVETLVTQRGASSMDQVIEKITTYARGHYLRGLDLKDYRYEIDIALRSVEYDADTDRVGAIIDSSSTTTSEIFQMNTEDDRAILEVHNKGDRPVYITIVEINSKGEICPFFPLADYGLTADDRKLNPGSVMQFKNHPYQFSSPFERLTLKAFATPEPLNFPSCLDSSTARGTVNPLLNFFPESTTRGGGAAAGKNGLKGFTTEFIYEIVKK